MSMARCSKCSELVDTDFDLDCYVDTGKAWEECICESCRERYGYEQDGLGTLPPAGGERTATIRDDTNSTTQEQEYVPQGK